MLGVYRVVEVFEDLEVCYGLGGGDVCCEVEESGGGEGEGRVTAVGVLLDAAGVLEGELD